MLLIFRNISNITTFIISLVVLIFPIVLIFWKDLGFQSSLMCVLFSIVAVVFFTICGVKKRDKKVKWANGLIVGSVTAGILITLFIFVFIAGIVITIGLFNVFIDFIKGLP